MKVTVFAVGNDEDVVPLTALFRDELPHGRMSQQALGLEVPYSTNDLQGQERAATTTTTAFGRRPPDPRIRRRRIAVILVRGQCAGIILKRTGGPRCFLPMVSRRAR